MNAPRDTGQPTALDGVGAVQALEAMAGSALVTHPDRAFSVIGGRLAAPPRAAGSALHWTEIEQVPGMLTGLTAGGLRAAALVAEPLALAGAVGALAGQRLSCVVHLCARAARRQAGALAGGHDQALAVADSGAFELVAANVQEVADLTLIAHRVAELALTPGLCVQDYDETGQSVQNLALPEAALVEAYLGRAGDTIATPSPAQRVLFGERRRRLPRWADVDQPAGLGGYQEADSFFRARAAQRPFFAAHLEPLLDQAMAEFARLSGRVYTPLAAYRCDDADVVVIAAGAVVETLQAVVDHLRSNERIRAGVLSPCVLRPFPGGLLTGMLKSRRAVTVLECADVPLAGEGPLGREVREAIDRAVENGAAAKNAPPFPGFARYRRRGDRPSVFHGSYGVGAAAPTFAELCAVFRNMRPGGAARRRFYLGADFDPHRERLPQLQVLAHQLREAYPDLERLSVPPPAAGDGAAPPAVIELDAPALQGGLFAGNLLARALHAALGEQIRTYPRGGLEPALRASRFALVHGAADCRARPEAAAMLLVSGAGRVATLEPGRLAPGGTLVVASERDEEHLWREWAGPVERWIRERGVRVLVVPARAIALESEPPAALVDPLALWALLGAALGAERRYASALAKIRERLADLLRAALGPDEPLADLIDRCLRLGAERAAELDWHRHPPQPRAPVAEPDPPWTVPADPPPAAPVFDRSRFWHSVGYLHDRGRGGDALVDPFLATAVLPAATSAPRDMTAHRRRLPQWLPENCTGCGLCWALCPDSALPPSVHDLSAILDAAIAAARGPDVPMTQMARVTKHLSQQAHRLIARDGLNQYRSAGALLEAAFDQLLAKLTLDEAAERTLRGEFAALRPPLEDWPVARTEAFFDRPERAEKGSGALLSIGLNGSSCKACGVCVEACPDGAFAWIEQDPAALARARRNWAFQHRLPEVAVASYLQAGEAPAQVNRLLAERVYHCLAGGDGADPGNASKTAVHLVVGAIESVMQARYRAHAEHLAELIAALRAKIQGEVSGAVEINDFEAFAARLARLERGKLGAEALGSLLGAEQSAHELDPLRLSRLSRLLAQLERQRGRYASGAGGRARVVLVLTDGEVLRWSGTYPDNPHANPWIRSERGAAAGLVRGLFEATSRRLAREIAACRLAAAELKDRCPAADHVRLREALGWDDLKPEEQALLPPLLVIGERRTTTWSEVAELLAARGPIGVAIVDGDGIALPPASIDSHALLALDAAEAFVLQTSVGHPGHLIGGVVEALEAVRPALFQVFAPDLLEAGIAPEKMYEQARLAYQSRAVPLFRYDPARTEAALSLSENPAADAPWAPHELSVHEADGERTLTAALTVADWALGQQRFRDQFQIVARGHAGEQSRPLADWLALDPPAREGLTPYVHLTDANGRLFVARVSAPLAAATEACRRTWRSLRRRAGGAQPVAETATASASAPPSPAPPVAASSQEQLTERLLRLCGYADDPAFFNRSLRQYLDEHRRAPQPSPDEPGT